MHRLLPVMNIICTSDFIIISRVVLQDSQQIYIIFIRGSYHRNPKILDTRKYAVISLKVEQDGFSLE